MCDDLNEDGIFLAIDYRIDCESSSWKGSIRLVALVGVALWPIGFPLACLGMLYWHSVPSIAKRKAEEAAWHAYLQYIISEFISRRLPVPITADMLETDLTDDNLRSILRVAHAPSATEPLATADALDVVEAKDQTQTGTDEFDPMTRAELFTRINKHLNEMEESEQLPLPTLVWGVRLTHRELSADEQVASRRMGFLISACTPPISLSALIFSLYWWISSTCLPKPSLAHTVKPHSSSSVIVAENATFWNCSATSFFYR